MTMFPGGVCPERQQLLRKAVEAIYVHSCNTSKMLELASSREVRGEDFLELQQSVQEYLDAAQRALDEYQQHVQEHDC